MNEKKNFRIPGLVRWFRFEKYKEVEDTVRDMRELRVGKLRTALSWADWERPGGPEWFDWFITRLFEAGIEVMPSLFYTPAERAYLLPGQTIEQATTCFPPNDPQDYAAFCRSMATRYGNALSSWYQIWNEPNNDAYYSPQHDPDLSRFASMAHLAMDVFHGLNKRVVLGGIIPPYANWLLRMKRFGVLQRADAVGIHAFPGTWDKMVWPGWPDVIRQVRGLLEPEQQVWITETGYSTVELTDQSQELQRRREKEQVRRFEDVCRAPAEQIFWHSIHDQDPAHPTDNSLVRGTSSDPRAYHFGLITHDGRKKLLFDFWKLSASI